MIQTHIKHGVITGLALLVLGTIIYLMNWQMATWTQYVTYAIFLGGIVINAINYSKANHAEVTFGQVFSSGFKTTAIITLISIAWSVISIMIFPEMKEVSMEMARESMIKQGMDDSQMDEALEATSKYFTLFAVMGVLFGYMLLGLLFSAIGAAVAKKKGKPQVTA